MRTCKAAGSGCANGKHWSPSDCILYGLHGQVVLYSVEWNSVPLVSLPKNLGEYVVLRFRLSNCPPYHLRVPWCIFLFSTCFIKGVFHDNYWSWEEVQSNASIKLCCIL